MHEFHYKHIKNKYNAKLLFTDTDSLVHEIKSDDVMKIFMRIKISLILVIIHKIPGFLILLIKKLLLK